MARLLCPSNFPGKNTGVGCHLLLQGNLPDPRIKPSSPVSLTLAAGFFTNSVTCEAPRNWDIFNSWFSLPTVFSSVQFSRSVVSNTLQTHGLQHTRPPCPSPTPRVYSNSCPSSQWCHLASQLSSPSPPAPNPSQHQGLFQWVNSSHEVAKVLELQF